jgi:hypothetical protein
MGPGGFKRSRAGACRIRAASLSSATSAAMCAFKAAWSTSSVLGTAMS